jgi:hypothetical protein
MATMQPVVTTIEIAVAPSAAFSYASDPTRFSEWQADVVTVRADGPVPLPVGARFHTTRRVGGSERTFTQEVVESNPPHRWAARGIDGPIRPHAVIEVEPTANGTESRVTFSLDFSGHGAGVALLPLVRRLTRRGAPVSYQRLKRILESV